LRFYFTAVQFGWEAEARKAALCAASRPIEGIYVPEMEFVSADVYYRLLEYCHNLQSRVATLIRPHQGRNQATHQVWCLQDDKLCRDYMPRWWYVDHQDAGNLPAWVAALVVGHLQLQKLGSSEARLRESRELATRIEEGLSEVGHIRIPLDNKSNHS
jgi:hypothetical protein